MDTTLNHLIELNRYSLIINTGNYTTSSTGRELIPKEIDEHIKQRASEWAFKSFEFMGSPPYMSQESFLEGIVCVSKNAETLRWAKKIADENYADPLMYHTLVAIRVKEIAKEDSSIRQEGDLLSLVQPVAA